MRAAHSNLWRQNTVYSHKKYVILQHLLLMQLIVDTRWAKGTWNTSVELLRLIWRNSSIRHTPWKRLRFTCAAREAEAFGTWRKSCIIYSAFMCSSSESLVLHTHEYLIGRAWTLSSVKHLDSRVSQSLFDMCVTLHDFHVHGTSYFSPCRKFGRKTRWRKKLWSKRVIKKKRRSSIEKFFSEIASEKTWHRKTEIEATKEITYHNR